MFIYIDGKRESFPQRKKLLISMSLVQAPARCQTAEGRKNPPSAAITFVL